MGDFLLFVLFLFFCFVLLFFIFISFFFLFLTVFVTTFSGKEFSCLN